MNHRCDPRGLKLIHTVDRLSSDCDQLHSPHAAGSTAYSTSHIANGIATLVNLRRKNVDTSPLSGRSRNDDAIRNSGTAGRISPLIRATLHRLVESAKLNE